LKNGTIETGGITRDRGQAYLDRSRIIAELRLLPNLISIGRLLLIIPIALLYPLTSSAAYWTVLVLLVVSYLSDYADGYLARRLKQQSRLGLILDPVADKIWTLAMVFLLCRFRELPVWIMLVVVGRDAGILAINIRLLRHNRVVMPSDDVGRIYLVLLGLMIIGTTLRLPAMRILAYGIVLLAVVTMFRYFQRYRRIVEGSERPELDPDYASLEDD